MMEHQNNTEPGNRNNATPPASLGAMLREARERLNLSVAEVAAQIKFAPRQIEALESGDFKHLPEAAFLRGFVRSYAKILNLDAQPLLAAMPQEKMASAELIPASVEVPYPVENTSQRQTLILLGAALLLAVIAVGFSVWHFTTPLRQSPGAKLETTVPLPAQMEVSPEPTVQKHYATLSPDTVEPKREISATDAKSSIQSDRTRAEASGVATAAQSAVRAAKTKAVASVAQSSVPAVRTKADASATAAQSSVRAAKTKAVVEERQTQTAVSGNIDGTEAPHTVLKLVFDEESWTEIQDKDGKMISSQINPRGSELNVKGSLPLSLVIGHAATTHLYKDGQPVDLTPYINSYSEVARITLK
jgi:cytoskeleton protein RodZ